MRAFDVKGPGLGFRGLGIKVLGFLNLGSGLGGPVRVVTGTYILGSTMLYVHLKGLGCRIYRL